MARTRERARCSGGAVGTRRAVAAALFAALVVAGLAGCRRAERDAAGAAAQDPRARLSQLLRRGAQPGELTVAEREEVERLLLPLLPATEDRLEGYRWRVAYDDLPEGDFVAVDLLQGAGDAASRAMWFHLFWRGEPSAAERAGFIETVGRWPARGVDGHHLFVRVGGVELRAVADRDDFQDGDRIRAVVAGFDLDALARL